MGGRGDGSPERRRDNISVGVAVALSAGGLRKLACSTNGTGLVDEAIRGISWVALSQAPRRLAAEIGAPIGDAMRVAELNLGVWPEWFRPPASDDPPYSRTCGFVSMLRSRSLLTSKRSSPLATHPQSQASGLLRAFTRRIAILQSQALVKDLAVAVY